MKVLLTIDEYRERATKLVYETAKSVINPTADDWAKCKIGKTHANGSIIGKVKIHQPYDETENDCIVIED